MRVRSLAIVLALTVGAGVTAYVDPGPAEAARRTHQIGGTSCRAFPANNYWHADISNLPVHKRSRTWLSHMSTSRELHPDFGPSYGNGPNYGIPVTVVEGGRSSDGDRHAIVVDKSNCRLYETWATRVRSGRWHAGSGATWSLTSNK